MNTPMTEELQKAFGQLTAQQLWTLTKFAKHVRLRCRNNTAFNNFCNGTFPYARFETVTKQRQDGSTYPGLKITVKQPLAGTHGLTTEETVEGED